MTIITTTPPRDRLALWAGLTTLFTNLAAINILALLGDEHSPPLQIAAALITAIAAAGAVYARQHFNDEKTKRGHETETTYQPQNPEK